MSDGGSYATGHHIAASETLGGDEGYREGSEGGSRKSDLCICEDGALVPRLRLRKRCDIEKAASCAENHPSEVTCQM